jgi:hypothetical protein
LEQSVQGLSVGINRVEKRVDIAGQMDENSNFAHLF